MRRLGVGQLQARQVLQLVERGPLYRIGYTRGCRKERKLLQWRALQSVCAGVVG